MTAISGWVGLVLMLSFMYKGGVKKQVKRNEQDMDIKIDSKTWRSAGRVNLNPQDSVRRCQLTHPLNRTELTEQT